MNAFLEKHKILTIYLGVINIVTFFFFAIDKYRAVRNKSRIRIITLLGMAFAGGSVGALPGIYLLRHKTEELLHGGSATDDGDAGVGTILCHEYRMVSLGGEK